MHKIFFYTQLMDVARRRRVTANNQDIPDQSQSMHAIQFGGEMLAQPISIVILYIEMKAQKKETYASQYNKKKKEKK